MHGVVDLCAEFDVRKPVSNDTIFFCRADKIIETLNIYLDFFLARSWCDDRISDGMK